MQALRLCTGRTAHRGSSGIALLYHDHGTRRGEGSASRPGRSLPPEKTRYPLYRRLGGPQGRSGHVRKNSPPPGFDPRTVQPVASRYTDWATRPTSVYIVVINCSNILKHFFFFRKSISTCSHTKTLQHLTLHSGSCVMSIVRINTMYRGFNWKRNPKARQDEQSYIYAYNV